MFDGPDFPKSLDEAVFERWLEEGRDHKIRYQYLMVIWDTFERKYLPIYVEKRAQLNSYEPYGESVNPETVIAAYDLYSESRIPLNEA